MVNGVSPRLTSAFIVAAIGNSDASRNPGWLLFRIRYLPTIFLPKCFYFDYERLDILYHMIRNLPISGSAWEKENITHRS